jgi:hypothetical protein
MSPFPHESDDEDTLYDDVSRMADRLKLDGPERQNYIHDHMVQGGYEQVQSRESYRRKVEEPPEDSPAPSRWGFGGGRSPGRSGPSSGNDGDRF